VPVRKKSGGWTAHEDWLLKTAMESQSEASAGQQLASLGGKHSRAGVWKAVAAMVPGRTETQCRQRWTYTLKWSGSGVTAAGGSTGKWSAAEDAALVQAVSALLQQQGQQGAGAVAGAGAGSGSTADWDWSLLASQVPGRIAKQCRNRWNSHLDPSLKKGSFSAQEEAILQQHLQENGGALFPAAACRSLPGRTPDMVRAQAKKLQRKLKQRSNVSGSAAVSNAGSPDLDGGGNRFHF